MRNTLAGVVLGLFLAVLAMTNPFPRNTSNGFTNWNCSEDSPAGWVRSDLILENPQIAIATAVHEEKHVDQMEEWESCEEYKAAWNDSISLQMEAEAFCEESKIVKHLGLFDSQEEAIHHFGYILAAAYDFDISRDSASANIRAYCQPPL